MSKLSALKKAMKKAGKVAVGVGAAKIGYDILNEDSTPKPMATNPYEKGTREYVKWEIDAKKRRTGKP